MRADKGDPLDLDPVNQASAELQVLVVRAASVDLSEIGAGDSALLAALFKMPPPAGAAVTPSRTARTLYQQASPISYISADDPPTLSIHGDADQTVAFSQAIRFDAALKKAGVPSKLLAIPGGRHGGTFGLSADAVPPGNWPDYLGEMVRWLNDHLKPRHSAK
jgi:fermentation-respiration switch protein FrsA (DUF1100 family)